MIDRVHFKNFKSLADVSIDLGRFTVLVGPNGSGKSSVLQGLRLIADTAAGSLQGGHPEPLAKGIWGGRYHPNRAAFLQTESGMTLEAHESGGVLFSVQVQFLPEAPYDGVLSVELSLVEAGDSIGQTIPFRGSYPPEYNVLSDSRIARFRSAAYLNFETTKMVATSFEEVEEPHINHDGEGLASTLAWMKGAAEDDLAQITADLARVVPGVKRIRTLRESVKRQIVEKLVLEGQPIWRPVEKVVVGDRFEIQFNTGRTVPADLLSEGTVLALGLLTKLREPGRPSLFLLDDIDRGLHIEAQARLIAVLREMLASDHELQIVCTTHSPYLLNLFQPDEVRVLALDEHRNTHARTLSEHPDFEKWRFGTQTGELWAALGNAWAAVPQAAE